ncbi:eCIS core domain-containing protein [Uliginosibacterium sp. H1]|uniref:eCIS core domain-containing protein n=1 Tax=Uliginosibacterium sp. H1 TaxID=3114757 RepID=UPI002E182107|nr:DUF4157 domain-containing protein [Uliginosibacterium sp. H1]
MRRTHGREHGHSPAAPDTGDTGDTARKTVAPGLPRYLGMRTAADAGVSGATATDLEQQARQAQEQAPAVTGTSAAAAPGEGGGNGKGLPAAARTYLEHSFGTDLGDIRLHDDAASAATTRALKQPAFAYGNGIWLGSREQAGDLPTLAHETAHVLQQRSAGQAFLQGEDGPVCEQPPPLSSIEPMSCPAAPTTVETEVVVSSPRVDGAPARPDERVILSQPVSSSTGIVLYAIPRSALDYDPDAEAGGECPSPAPATTNTPPLAPASTDPAAGLPGSADRVLGAPLPATRPVSAGGVTLEAVSVTDAYVITTQYHHLAVGAGALTILETPDGVRLIDAGVGQEGGSVLADAIVERAASIIGNRPIVEVLITHLHADHTALLPRLAGRFDIGSLRVNALQFADPRFQTLLADIAREQAAGVQRRAAAEFDARRSTWDAGPGAEIADPALREAQFATARQAHVDQALTRLRNNPTSIDLLVPERGALVAVSAPMGSIAVPGTATTDPLLSGLRRPAPPGGPAITDVGDPALGRHLDRQQRASASDPTARVPDADIDAASSSYIIDLPGGNRLMVVPDARTDDIGRVPRDARGRIVRDASGGARSSFEAELARLGHAARFQVWNMTHHMQSGWVAGGAPHVVGVGQLTAFIQLMQNLREVQARGRAAGSPAAANAVMVSVLGDPGNPLARSLVNPGMVWFLRALGFETMLATSGRDLRVIEAMSASGAVIEGAAGLPYEGARPTDAILSNSEQALRFLDAEIARQRARSARGLSRADSAALVADRTARLDSLTTAHRQLETARNAYLEIMSRELWRGPDDTSRPAVAPDPAAGTPAALATAEATLRTAMASPELGTFAPEATTATPMLNEGAMVIMRLSDSAADASTRRYIELRTRMDGARARLASDAGNAVLRTQMLADLQDTQALLRQMLETAPEASRVTLREELVYNQREMEALLRPVNQGEAMFSREPGTGRLVESRVTVSAPPRTAADRVRGVTEGVGRGLGALMVVQTIRSEGELLEKAEEGRASAAETVTGTAHNALGISLGLRMARGIHVHPGEFVLLSALDIAHTVATEHGSHEANTVAITQSVMRNALTLGLMVIGNAMMRSGNPYVVAAGFGVTLLTEPIMMGLEAAGVFDAVERASAFLPSEVTGTTQSLRRLMAEYDGLVGARSLSARSDEELRGLGAHDPAALRTAASTDIATYTRGLDAKEVEVLDAFSTAYTSARTDYAGLFELDQLRDQFLRMRRQAREGGSSDADRLSRENALSRFATMDTGLSMATMSVEEINAMPQWESLRDAIGEYEEEAGDDEPDWEDLRDSQIQIEQMLRNARYRLDPSTLGLRSASMLPEGSPGRGAYETNLSLLSSRWQTVRRSGLEALTGTCIGTVTSADPAATVDQYLVAYQAMLDSAPSHPYTAAGLVRSSTTLAVDYRRHVESDSGLARYLLRLEIAERGLQGTLNELLTGNAVVSDAPAVQRRVQSAISQRRAIHGLYFLGELESNAAPIREREVATLAPLFESSPTRALSGSENAAMAEGELEDLDVHLSTVTNRLQLVPNLSLPANADDAVPGLYKVLGGTTFVVGRGYAPVNTDVLVIVGHTGRTREDHDLMTGGFRETEVIPINRAAVGRFGTAPRYLRNGSFAPVTRRELEADRPPAP